MTEEHRPLAPGAPKYATRRDSENPTYGKRVAAVGAFMGGSLMPWQRQVADVAMELDRHRPGAFRYDIVVVSVPRQAGKSFLLRAVMADRIMAYSRHEVLMTAQTGKDARKRWKQFNAALGAEKKPGYFAIRSSQGSERTEYLRRGSYVAPFAPTPKSIHGDSLHLVTVDEAWAFDAESGLALETAINPTQLTIPDSQLWIVSTKGTSKSAYLNELIRAGRSAVTNPESRMAYFEWSADEATADADPYSAATLAFHPALGHTQTLEKIRGLATGDVAAWRRSILNLETATDSTIVDMSLWDSLAAEPDDAAPLPDPSRVSIAVDIASDRSGGTIAAAWPDGDGGVNTAILASLPSPTAVLERLPTLARAGYRAVLVDDAGTMRTVLTDVINIDSDVAAFGLRVITTKEYAAACQAFLDRIAAGTIEHDGSQALRDALCAAVTRRLSGAVAFDPIKSPEPIDALRAVAIAAWHAATPMRDTLQIY